MTKKSLESMATHLANLRGRLGIAKKSVKSFHDVKSEGTVSMLKDVYKYTGNVSKSFGDRVTLLGSDTESPTPSSAVVPDLFPRQKEGKTIPSGSSASGASTQNFVPPHVSAREKSDFTSKTFREVESSQDTAHEILVWDQIETTKDKITVDKADLWSDVQRLKSMLAAIEGSTSTIDNGISMTDQAHLNDIVGLVKYVCPIEERIQWIRQGITLVERNIELLGESGIAQFELQTDDDTTDAISAEASHDERPLCIQTATQWDSDAGSSLPTISSLLGNAGHNSGNASRRDGTATNTDPVESTGTHNGKLNNLIRMNTKIQTQEINVQDGSISKGTVAVPTNTSHIHHLITTHKLVFAPGDFPQGKFLFDRMRVIKKRNPNLPIPANRAVFYGSIKFQYDVHQNDGTIQQYDHDVFAISGAFLDLRPRGPPKDPSRGLYGRDRINVYFDSSLLGQLSGRINEVTGFTLNDDGMIESPDQGLTSLTVYINDGNVPTVHALVPKKNKSGKVIGTEKTQCGDIRDVVASGGEEHLVGGIAFCSFGVSKIVNVRGKEPSAGAKVKLSVKMHAFHVLFTTSGGIRRITDESPSNALDY